MPSACFQCADTLLFAAKHAKGMSLRYGVIVFERHPTKKSFYSQGFSTEPNSCQKSFLLLKKCAFFTFFVGFVGFFLFLVYICGIFSRSINRQMCQLDATLKVDIGVEKGIQEK